MVGSGSSMTCMCSKSTCKAREHCPAWECFAAAALPLPTALSSKLVCVFLHDSGGDMFLAFSQKAVGCYQLQDKSSNLSLYLLRKFHVLRDKLYCVFSLKWDYSFNVLASPRLDMAVEIKSMPWTSFSLCLEVHYLTSCSLVVENYQLCC